MKKTGLFALIIIMAALIFGSYPTESFKDYTEGGIYKWGVFRSIWCDSSLLGQVGDTTYPFYKAFVRRVKSRYIHGDSIYGDFYGTIHGPVDTSDYAYVAGYADSINRFGQFDSLYILNGSYLNKIGAYGYGVYNAAGDSLYMYRDETAHGIYYYPGQFLATFLGLNRFTLVDTTSQVDIFKATDDSLYYKLIGTDYSMIFNATNFLIGSATNKYQFNFASHQFTSNSKTMTWNNGTLSGIDILATDTLGADTGTIRHLVGDVSVYDTSIVSLLYTNLITTQNTNPLVLNASSFNIYDKEDTAKKVNIYDGYINATGSIYSHGIIDSGHAYVDSNLYVSRSMEICNGWVDSATTPDLYNVSHYIRHGNVFIYDDVRLVGDTMSNNQSFLTIADITDSFAWTLTPHWIKMYKSLTTGSIETESTWLYMNKGGIKWVNYGTTDTTARFTNGYVYARDSIKTNAMSLKGNTMTLADGYITGLNKVTSDTVTIGTVDLYDNSGTIKTTSFASNYIYSGIYYNSSGLPYSMRFNSGGNPLTRWYILNTDNTNDTSMVEDSLLKQIRIFRDLNVKNDVIIDSSLTVGGGSIITKVVKIGSNMAIISGTDTFYLKKDSL